MNNKTNDKMNPRIKDDYSNLFILFDKYSANESQRLKYEIKRFIFKNPNCLYFIFNDISLYSHVTILGLPCLKLLHESTLAISNLLKFKHVEPYEYPSKNGYRPIHYAVNMNLPECVEYLIEEVGVDINAQDLDKNTALHIACMNQNMNIFKILLFIGNIDINILNKKLRTPLVICILNNNLEMVKDLIRKGGKTGIVNIDVFIKTYADRKIQDFYNKYKKSQKLKQKKKLSQQKYFEHRKKNYQKYQYLCSSLEDESNLELVKYFSKHFNVLDTNKTKKELCNEISKQISKYELQFKLKF